MCPTTVGRTHTLSIICGHAMRAVAGKNMFATNFGRTRTTSYHSSASAVRSIRAPYCYLAEYNIYLHLLMDNFDGFAHRTASVVSVQCALGRSQLADNVLCVLDTAFLGCFTASTHVCSACAALVLKRLYLYGCTREFFYT